MVASIVDRDVVLLGLQRVKCDCVRKMEILN